MKCLLLRPDKAGDALKSLPAIRALKSERPELVVHVLASEHNASLFETEPGITVHELPSEWEKWRASRLRGYLFSQGMPPAFDVAVNLLADPFPSVQRLLLMVPAPKKYSVTQVGWSTAEGGSFQSLPLPYKTPAGRDETENIADILSAAFNCSLSDRIPEMRGGPIITDSDRAEAQALLPKSQARRFGLCPFAGTAQRSPNLKRWKKLLKKLSRKEPTTEWVIFAPANLVAHAEALIPVESANRFRVVTVPSFRILAACFENLEAVLAVDSGPLHLAQAMGVPSLGFLSGGDRARWFARLNPKDGLLPRGLFSRFPSSLEMWWAFRRWLEGAYAQR